MHGTCIKIIVQLVGSEIHVYFTANSNGPGLGNHGVGVAVEVMV